MTTPEAASLTEQIAGLLAEVAVYVMQGDQCSCGWSQGESGPAHRNHVAAGIAGRLATETVADAIEAAFDADNATDKGQEFSGDYNDGYVYAMELAIRTARTLAARLADSRPVVSEAAKAEAYHRGWLDSAIHHATCTGCGTGALRHAIPDPYRLSPTGDEKDR